MINSYSGTQRYIPLLSLREYVALKSYSLKNTSITFFCDTTASVTLEILDNMSKIKDKKYVIM